MRPQKFEEYIGQEKIKKRLEVSIKACQIKGTPLPHILLVGRPGLGKTSLAYVISREMNANFFQTVGSSLRDDNDLAKIFVQLLDNQQNLLFIDEVHSLPKYTEEKMYQLLEDGEIELTINDETNIYTLPPLTILGATTKVGSLTKPFIDRFGLQFQMEDYSVVDLAFIIAGVLAKMGLQIDGENAVFIASRARGTPRIAVNLAQRVGDMAIVRSMNRITTDIIDETMFLYEIDELGLTPRDYKFLEFLIENDRPVGIGALASAIGEDKATIEQVIEPYLVQQGLIVRTSRGRAITDKGIEYITSKMYI